MYTAEHSLLFYCSSSPLTLLTFSSPAPLSTPLSVRNMLSALKSPLAFSVPFCQQLDCALHNLSGCQHNIFSGMITERHNVACRLIMKAISKGSLAGCKAHMDAGSTTALPKKTFKFPSTLVIGLYPFGFLMLVCLSETGLLPVALMLFWLLPYLLNLRHLPLPNCNKCSMLIS